jgi:hypothetical protein
MNFTQIEKQESIILIVTSFIQLNNFLSFFLEKKLIANKKIYLVLFSDSIPDQLILQLKGYIKKFTVLELIDLRRKSVKIKKKKTIRLLRVFLYYYLVLKKIFQIKKINLFPYFVSYSKIQFTTLLFMIFLPLSKIIFLEDGLGDYLNFRKSKKNFILNYLLKKILNYKKLEVNILQLAKSKNDYKGIFDQHVLNKKKFLNNRNLFLNFLKNEYEKNQISKLKCIVISTKHTRYNFNYYKKLYIQTLIEIKKTYSYSSDQILFFPHPRDESYYIEDLKINLSNYSNIKSISSTVAENYLHDNNIEIVIGTYSTALYYSKIIFDKEHVYYIKNYENLGKNNELNNNIVGIFDSLDIKNFLIKNEL